MTKKRNRYTRAFKLEVIHLVTQQNYKVREATEAMGVGQSTLEGWLAQYRREQSSLTPSVQGNRAMCFRQIVSSSGSLDS